MNRTAFFASVRARTPLSQKQVDGLNAILDEAERRGTPLNHLAYILASADHETGGQMQPVKETVYATSIDRNPSDATVIKRLDKAFAAGKLPWVEKPYWREGWFGRGLIQLTHERNYIKFGVTKATALELKTSVRVMFDGMTKSAGFTKFKLSDFITDSVADYYSARAVVNGDKKANGAKIAVTAKAFETALKAAGYDPSAPKPVSDLPAPSFDLNPKPATSTKETTAFWPALIRYVLTLWKGRKS